MNFVKILLGLIIGCLFVMGLAFFALAYSAAEQRLYYLAAKIDDAQQANDIDPPIIEVSLDDQSKLRFIFSGQRSFIYNKESHLQCSSDEEICAMNVLRGLGVDLLPSEIWVK